MHIDDLKISELRATFDRENSRKESLQSKASYFLGVISIVVTIICTNISFLGPIEKYYSILGITILIILIASFSFSVGLCLFMFLPKNYAHPFILSNFGEFMESFEVETEEFKENLFDAYITSIKINHDLNDKQVFNLNLSIISFIIFIITMTIMVVVL